MSDETYKRYTGISVENSIPRMITEGEVWPLMVPQPNAELAWRALDTARDKGKLNMGSWFGVSDVLMGEFEVTPEQLLNENMCGTTACHAGWVVALSGYTMRDEPNGTMAIAADGSSPGDVMGVARALLGISDDEAYALFLDSHNDTIEQAITDIFGPRPEKTA